MITLTSKPQRVKSILKTTKAMFFEDVNLGDILVFSYTVKGVGRGQHSGLHATYIKVENKTQGSSAITDSVNNICNRLSCFELEES